MNIDHFILQAKTLVDNGQGNKTVTVESLLIILEALKKDLARK